jgi:hypothetical protein
MKQRPFPVQEKSLKWFQNLQTVPKLKHNVAFNSENIIGRSRIGRHRPIPGTRPEIVVGKKDSPWFYFEQTTEPGSMNGDLPVDQLGLHTLIITKGLHIVSDGDCACNSMQQLIGAATYLRMKWALGRKW